MLKQTKTIVKIDKYLASVNPSNGRSAIPAFFIGHYKPKGKLGVGGQAVVYRMENTETGQQVAMKVGKYKDARIEYSFLKELEGIPGIPKVLDFFEEDEEDFIVLPLLACDLSRDGHRYPKDFVLRFGMDLVKILKDVHGRGILHRDIKPQNVMIAPASSDSRLLLVDFSIAVRYKNPDGSKIGLMNNDRTFNLADYFSPNMDEGNEAAPLDDVIMVGFCMMWLSNFRPFEQVASHDRRQEKLKFLAEPETLLKGELEFLIPFWEKIGAIQIWEDIDYDDLVQMLKEGLDEPAEPGASYPLQQHANGYFL